MMHQYNPLSDEKFEEYKRQILSADLKNADVEELRTLIARMFDGLKITAQFLPEGQIYYRGVFWQQKPTKIGQISYPPKEFAKINRASEQGEQLFYCSSTKQITFYEVGAKPGDRFAISTWRSQARFLVNNIGYTNNNIKKMGGDREIKLPEIKYKIPNYDQLPQLSDDRMNFICDLFCQPVPPGGEEIYKLTTAIARIIYQPEARFSGTEEMKFHGFHFPSIKTKGNHDNFVFCIPVIDKKLLTLESVEYVEVESVDHASNKYRYKIIDYADQVRGWNIMWKELTSTWTLDDDKEISIVENGNGISIFDDSMNQISPD